MVAAFFILSLTVSSAHSLANQQSKCPNIKVSVPDYVVQEGKAILFSAQITGGNAKLDLTYNWAISAGEIIAGQGTPTIRVATKELAGQSVTATVEIGGVNPDCPQTASTTVDVEAKPAAKEKFAPPKTLIKDAHAKRMLLGKHRFSLQWVSWDYFGKALVNNDGGTLFIYGEQKARQGNDYVKIDGFFKEVSTDELKFFGTIEVQVSHNNNGKVCKRQGDMIFKITQNRKYWRLQEMQSPCGIETDYVDIFFR